jgi:drug/metabolite transporter (DMT)-like permease
LKKTGIFLPYLAGLAMATIFGLSFMFTKQALETLPAMLLLSCRFVLASLLLTLLWGMGLIKLSFKGKPFKQLLMLSFFQPIAYFIFETIGVKLTSSSEAGIMIALIPVVVTILAAIFLDEKPGRVQLVFILASVLGVAFISLMSGSSNSSSHFAGLFCLLGAVLAGSTYSILSRKLSNNYTPVEITFVMMWTGAAVFSIVAAASGIISGELHKYPAYMSTSGTLIPILYLGILSSVCAFFMLNYMLSKLPATNSVVFSNLTTVISIAAGVFVRHEAFHWYQLAGGIMIILGVWGTNRYKPKQQLPIESTESL